MWVLGKDVQAVHVGSAETAPSDRHGLPGPACCPPRPYENVALAMQRIAPRHAIETSVPDALTSWACRC